MLYENRVIWSDNGTLKDMSVELSNSLSGTYTIPLVAAEDAIYIGTDMPFNHRWIEVSTANTSASVVSVQLWNGSAFEDCVDVIDQTAAAGKTLAQSGILSWVPDRLRGAWQREDSTENVTGLTALKIYDLYWVKLTFSGNFLAGTALKYVGHKFADDAELVAEYPELGDSNLKTAFAAGKTTWADQHFIAAEYIIKDLRAMGIIWSKNQILDWRQFTRPEVHKCAEIIFRAFGDDYKDNASTAAAQYKASLKAKSIVIDTNGSGRAEPEEKVWKVGILTR